MDPRVKRTRTRALAAAQELLRESGPAAVTYSGVAERSGLGRATLYRHWPSINSLLEDLITQRAAMYGPQFTGDLNADLRASLRAMHQRLDSRRVEFLTMLERANRDPAIRVVLDTMEQLVPMRRAIELAVANGRLPADFDVSLGISLLLGPLLHREFVSSTPVDDEFIAAVVDSFLRTV